jgi:RNA polymerase sigma-70 factor (ECF subfamily)
VYRSHVRRVYGFLARRVGPSLAEDITAQTFLEVWSGWNRFDSDRGSETAWVFGIAANLLRRHRRRENAQLRAYARAGADPTTVDFDEAGVVDRVTVRAGWSQVATVLAALSDTDRNILTLTGWAGLSYEEVAFALQVPIGTVKSRLNRARAKLGQALVPAMGSVSNHRSVGVGVR